MAKTVLIANVSNSLRTVVKIALTGVGYNVLEAEGGQAALALMDGRPIDMLVSDLNMPVMNGIELVKAAKLLPDYKSIPIMMLTTDRQELQREDGKVAGIGAWMVKPFSPSQLVKTVDKLCS
jgi:two-component system chemotaxis response regulator CheY